MALVDTTWYVNFGDGSTTGYYAVTRRPQNAAVAAGVLRRQFTAPAAGNERVFVCIVAGTTANTTDATWTLTRGAKTTDGTATWQECSGQAALNGDLTNTATWAQVKAATPAVLGQIIKRSNNASYQICTTAGAMSASEPAFSDTAGVTTTDTTAVWTSLGAVSNFTGGQAPHAFLINTFGTNWFASGHTVYIGDNHAETFATTMTIAPASALMAKILCHNHSGSYPPASGDLTTGATVTTTSGASTIFSGQGSFYFRGVTFVSGSSGIIVGATAVGQVHNWYYFDKCSFQVVGAGASSYMQIGGFNASTWSIVTFNDTTVKFSSTVSYLSPSFTQFSWRNTASVLVSGSAVPAVLFKIVASSGALSTVLLEGLDLSQFTGDFSLNTVSAIDNITIKDCKLNAAATISTPINTGMTVQLAASASDATSYKSSRHTYEAVETTETSIVRTGGYAQSRKIVTTANTQWLRPYQAQPLAVWNATTGSSKTVTVYGTVNAGSLPLNDEIWLDVSYLGSSSFPVGSVATSTKAKVLDAGVSVASDGSSWGTVASYPTWELATVSAVTLSGGNLIATNTGTTSTNQGAHVVSTVGKISGKWYFEVDFNVIPGGANTGTGIGTTASTYTNLGNSATTGVLIFNSGNVWANGSNTGVAFGLLVSGNKFGIAVDLDNLKIWFKRVSGTPSNWNNNASYDPATNVGGVTIPAGTMVPFCTFGGSSGVPGNAFVANFGASAFTGTVPSGFASGWGDLYTPFKLTATLTPQLPGYLIPQVKVAKASSTYYVDPLAVVT